VTQHARQLTWNIAEGQESFRFVIRDRDPKFTDSFDDVFRSVGMEILRTPFRAPQANGVAERFVRTVRSECLDRLLILDQGHLERTVAAFIDHYNGHRPHRALTSVRRNHYGSRRRLRQRRMEYAFGVGIGSVA
jgi:putative transposase